jgi:hypothetical protein
MLDIPPGTVMSRISRGRRLLYQQLVAARQSSHTEVEPTRAAASGRES